VTRAFVRLAWIGSLAAVACQPADPAWRLTIAGASVGGAWSAIGEALADELRRAIPGAVFTLEPGQDGANAALVADGKVDLALVHSSLARAALRGEPPYTRRYENLAAVALLYPQAAFHFVVARRTGLRDIGDIRTRRFPLRVGLNTRGSLMELATRTVLEAYGLSYDDLRRFGGGVYYYPLNESYQMLADGRMDAVTTTLQIPSQQTLEASRSVDLVLLPLSDEAIAFCNARLGTEPYTIPRGTYPFQTADVPTFAGRVILVARRTLPDEQVYRIVQVIHDRLGRLRRAHRALGSLAPGTLPQVGLVPLHPGAARFYREIGAL
jgi:TRAP transporter TAXI family solute receptor